MFQPLPHELITDRLRLRPWTPSDAEAYRNLWMERDPRSVRVIDKDGRPTVEDIRDRLRANPIGAEQGLGPLPIERREEGDFIGYCGLIVGRACFEEPEIAFELARRAHGRGYATEAAEAIVYAATATGRKRLWATVRAWNGPSFRVLEKLGFQQGDRVTEDPARGDLIWMTRRL